ncbi:hypothetical protein B0T11DRAFT_312366 [Plectosphaerella cucumerina]|uniref:Uncharacterized protein n=1 Tax=Plectosphaerella cucumerina TaxID=40658 RepID=A0A8K0TBI0_9PEZI|nr:hypothetical protein B0T11DRAFT_312366 [Plectosphaerella cucumerina]
MAPGVLYLTYIKHEAEIVSTWRSLDKDKRTEAVKAGSANREVPRHRNDKRLGNRCLFIPEWNLQDLTEPGSDFLLDLLRHRATTSLEEQYLAGVGGGLSDYDIIHDAVVNHGVRHWNRYPDSYNLLIDGVGFANVGIEYGLPIRPKSPREDSLRTLEPLIDRALCIPQDRGELVLERQSYILGGLVIIIDNIMDLNNPSPPPGPKTKKSKNARKAAAKTFPNATVPAPTEVDVSLSDLVDAATDRVEAYLDYDRLIRANSGVLAHAVNITYFSRPELMPNESGRTLPAYTDKHIPRAFVETLQCAARGAAVWLTISRLLCLVQDSVGQRRATAVQHVANVCHAEYIGAQASLSRQLSTTNACNGLFRRTASPGRDGNYRLVQLKKAEEKAKENPTLRSLLRLCKSGTSWAEAAKCIKTLDDLYRNQPAQRDELGDEVADALSDVAEIFWLTQSLSKTEVITAIEAVDLELDGAKDSLRLAEFTVPREKIARPESAAGALRRLDKDLGQAWQGGIASRYSTATSRCVDELEAIPDDMPTGTSVVTADAKVSRKGSDEDESTTPQPEKHPKIKTRPAQPPSTTQTEMRRDDEDIVMKDKASAEMLVTTNTMGTMTALFSRFESAMADLGFSILPRGGSVYTYTPPSSFSKAGQTTIHRPHGAKLERYRLQRLAHRLRTRYGWTTQSFKVRGTA